MRAFNVGANWSFSTYNAWFFRQNALSKLPSNNGERVKSCGQGVCLATVEKWH
ncbi:hypothetical protein [Colwellia sp. MB02u-9]|uniref:hypothetical protein n=1 Tax=Colwellia sp. MB02u-9 TaxID=2759823 RepID=UPI0015F455DB|nr:hypothetical protein [Colwellia sp. MB02u-9]MBA6297074.1 hypothetical protein [Colwellia sp. MB02u-9]